ncbi:MAG: M50 family metallopeptidase [Anaerolineae bacterium]|nr:M50 family metallopeptidase [Anaerolineae bacterium]
MFLEQPYFRRHALMVMLLAGVIVFVLWNIPQLDFLLFPFRLFVTYVHEAGHSVMAAFSGGRVIEFTVFSNGTGIATTQGGNRFLILPAGYLGAAFFGAVLFYLANTVPFPRKISLVVGTLMIVITLFLRASGIALLVGALSGSVLVFVGIRGSILVNMLLLNLLAALTGLNAVFDLIFLVQNSYATLGQLRNDAAAFAELTPGIPAFIWALIWAILAVFMVGSAIWFSVVRPLRQGKLA